MTPVQTAMPNYSSRSSTLGNMYMSHKDFKQMCHQMKVYPVVVSEEIVDKVIGFCANKRPIISDDDHMQSSNKD